jgi:hypothetical protein
MAARTEHHFLSPSQLPVSKELTPWKGPANGFSVVYKLGLIDEEACPKALAKVPCRIRCRASQNWLRLPAGRHLGPLQTDPSVRRAIGTTPQLAQKLVFCNSDLDKSTAVCNHERHACEAHAHEVHARDMHAREVQINHKHPHTG